MLSPEELKPMLKPLLVSRGLPVDADVVKLWQVGLDGLTSEEANSAIAEFVRTSSEYPTPAAVRRCAGPKGLSNGSRASIAWGEVLQAIRSRGAYETVDFEDRIINAVIREMGGWVALCDTPSSELLVWARKRFEELYGAVASSGAGESAPLPGIVATTNARLGHDGPSAVGVPSRLPAHVAAARIARTEPRRIEAPRPVVADTANLMRIPEPPPRLETEEPLTELECAEKAAEEVRRLKAWDAKRLAASQSFQATFREIA